MNYVKIGKTITFDWQLQVSGVNYPLTDGQSVEIEVTFPHNSRRIIIIPDITASGTAQFKFKACEAGKYIFSCYIDRHTDNETSCDVEAFTAVYRSWLEKNDPDDVITSDNAVLVGNLVNPEFELTDYVTKDELTARIQSVEVSGVDLTGYARTADVPTKVSQLTNDLGYLNRHQSLADYARTENVYTKTEVDNLLSTVDVSVDLAGYARISSIPTRVSQLTNDLGYITQQVDVTDIENDIDDLQELTDIHDTSIVELSNLVELNTNDIAGKIDASLVYTKDDITDILNNISLNGGDVSVDLSNYAKLADIPTKTSELTNDSGYLIEHQSLTNYALKSELPTKTSDLTNDSGYLIEHQSLTNYALKSELFSGSYTDLTNRPTIPTKTSDLTNDSGYLTSHQDLSSYALKSELPTVPTKVSQLTNDSGYLTEHQSLTNYALKSELFSGSYTDLTNKPTIPTKTSDLTNDANFVTSNELGNIDLTGYARTEDVYTKSQVDGLLENIDASVDLSDYAQLSDIPTVPTKVSELTNDSGYLTEHQSLSAYALKTELPTKTSDLTNDSGYLTSHLSLSNYALKSEIPTKNSQLTNDSGYLTTHQSLSDYALNASVYTKEEIDNKGYLTSHQSLSAYALKSEIPTVPTKVSQLTNDSGYLTEHQSLVSYALKSELPTKTSDLTNDSGYLTSHQSLSAYALKTEIPSKTSDLTNDSGYLTSHQSLSAYVNGGDYDSTNKKIRLLNGQTVIAQIDAAAFIKDGMVSNVEITNGNIVVSFNTDAGLEDISIPITDIFNANNYYTKTNVDTLLADKQSTIADINDIRNFAVKGNTAYNWGNHANAGYLTEHQDLSDYALLSDIPTVPTLVSAFTNDAGYLTSHQDLSSYALKSELFSGSYTDLTNKPTIPTKTSQLTNDSGYLTSHQNISGKADKLSIQASSSTVLQASANKYYRFDSSIDTLSVTLPNMSGATYTQSILFFMPINTDGVVTFGSSDSSVYYTDGFSLDGDNTYEVNAMYNGNSWVIAAIKINTVA